MSNEAKPRLAPYGLLSPAVNQVPLSEREVESVDYEVYCGLGAKGEVVCDADATAATLSTAASEHYKTYKTVVFEYTLNCSTMGMTPALLREKMEIQRAVQLESFLGNELWNGTVAQTATSTETNRYLTDGNATVLTSTSVSPDDALGLVEQGIAEEGIGGVGVVHVPKLLLSRLDIKEKDKDGILWTKGGNIVVSSTGYGTNGATAGEGSWIFGTGLVTVRLGEAVFYDDQMKRIINTQNNTIELVGEQPVAVTWNDCVQVAAQVNINGIN